MKTTPTTNQTELPINLTKTVLPIKRPTMAILNEDFPKISDANADELIELVNYMAGIINIKVDNTEEAQNAMDEQMLLIGDLLRTEFGRLVTVPEVKQAFKMYITKQFHGLRIFRVLDCIAVSEIILAFINYRSDKLRTYQSQKQKAMLIHEANISNRIKRFKILRNGLWKCYVEFLQTGIVDDGRFYLCEFLYEIEYLPSMQKSKKIWESYESKKQLAIKQIVPEDPKEKNKEVNTEIIKDVIGKIVNGDGNEKLIDKRWKALILTGMFEKLKNEWTKDFSGCRKCFLALESKFENFV